MLVERDGLEPGLSIARRFFRFKDLPEHPLLPRIHTKIASGAETYGLAKWIQSEVPPDDPLGSASIRLKSLDEKLRRYRRLLPPAAMLPANVIDDLLRRADIEIDVINELSALIWYQKDRITLFAARERSLPNGTTSEQQRREVETLARLYGQLREAQVAIGAVGSRRPGMVPANQPVAESYPRLGNDPLSRLLLDNPGMFLPFFTAVDKVMQDMEAAEKAAYQPRSEPPSEPDPPPAGWAGRRVRRLGGGT